MILEPEARSARLGELRRGSIRVLRGSSARVYMTEIEAETNEAIRRLWLENGITPLGGVLFFGALPHQMNPSTFLLTMLVGIAD